MYRPLIINSNGKAQREDSLLNKKFPLSALGLSIDKRSLVARKFIMNQNEWEDILKYCKE